MKKLLKGFAVSCLIVFGAPANGYAQTSSSSNYSVEESAFSTGSGSGTSASFGAQFSVGDLGIGEANSTSYGAYAGPVSPNEEYLEMSVTAAIINLDTPSGDPGALSNTETATGVGYFYVRAYLNKSYSVVTISQPLTNPDSDTINPLATAAAPSVGVEQFGINLVANTTLGIGAAPVPDPTASFANGEAAPGYDTDGLFQYNQGDTIAQHGGNPAWGQTNYTISYIANISGITEAGSYQMVHELAAVPTF